MVEIEKLRDSQMRETGESGGARSAARDESGQSDGQSEVSPIEKEIQLGQDNSFLPADLKKAGDPNLTDKNVIEYHLKGVRQPSKNMEVHEGAPGAFPNLSKPSYYRSFTQRGKLFPDLRLYSTNPKRLLRS